MQTKNHNADLKDSTQSLIPDPWFVLGAAILWGTTGTAQAFAPLGATPLSVGAVRLAIGGAALLIYAVGRGVLRRGTHWPRLAMALAAGGVAAYQPFFFSGVALTGVAVGTIVGIGSSPILAGLIDTLILREPPHQRWFLATGFAIIGSILLVSQGEAMQVNVAGVLLAMGAGAAYAVYTASSKTLLKFNPPDAVVAIVFSLGGLLLSPLLIFTDMHWLVQPSGAIVALHLGLVTTALAYVFFARGLARIPSATAVTLSLAEPLTAGTLGILVLGERLTSTGLAGMGLLFTGLALLSIREH